MGLFNDIYCKRLKAEQARKEYLLSGKQLFDTVEAAQYLGISKNMLRDMKAERRIPYVQIGRLIKFNKADLDTYIRNNTQEQVNFY